MTEREKANELISIHSSTLMYFNVELDEWEDSTQHAKQCAIICVDEILKQCEDANYGMFSLFWEEVKQEINKL